MERRTGSGVSGHDPWLTPPVGRGARAEAETGTAEKTVAKRMATEQDFRRATPFCGHHENNYLADFSHFLRIPQTGQLDTVSRVRIWASQFNVFSPPKRHSGPRPQTGCKVPVSRVPVLAMVESVSIADRSPSVEGVAARQLGGTERSDGQAGFHRPKDETWRTITRPRWTLRRISYRRGQESRSGSLQGIERGKAQRFLAVGFVPSPLSCGHERP